MPGVVVEALEAGGFFEDAQGEDSESEDAGTGLEVAAQSFLRVGKRDVGVDAAVDDVAAGGEQIVGAGALEESVGRREDGIAHHVHMVTGK